MKNDNKYEDFPFDEVVAEAAKLTHLGVEVYQKFTCSGCGQRLTIATPNCFHKSGACDKCPTITDIESQGCNYVVVISYGEAETRQ